VLKLKRKETIQNEDTVAKLLNNEGDIPFMKLPESAGRKLFPKNTLFCILVFLGLMVAFHSAFAQDTLKDNKYKNAALNHKCFKCHGHKFYTYYNDWTDKNVIKRMNPYYVIDSVTFYINNHCKFKCIDCHDADYAKFPHDGELQMEEMSTCLDCHEDDDVTAKYHFKEIYKEFKKSIHVKKFSNFTCWMCHDPHKYRLTVMKNENIHKVIIYDNNICLSCHSNIVNYKVLSDSAHKNITAAHDWLPNQKLHFQNVRCIDCHAKEENDSIVSHDILPTDESVKKCVECHSKNTILLATLYKFQAKELRNKNGFLNATILNNSYVISANRNSSLDTASLVIFGLVIALLIIHGIIRIILK
jgi:hypothetical protein